MDDRKKNNTKRPKALAESSSRAASRVFGELGVSIIESINSGIVAYDTDLKIIHANSKAARLVDLDEYLDASLAKGTDQMVWGNWTKQLKDSIDSDSKAQFDLVKYSHNDKKGLLSIVCSPLKDTGSARVLGGTAVIEDVTQRVNVEHQLAQAERLASVGKVAGKVAHELNNPIDGILRYINLALRVMDTQDNAKASEYLQHSKQGLMRMVGIISELLEFSRFAHISFEPMAVDLVIDEALRVMESVTGDIQIQVIKDYTGKSPYVKGGNIFQVFCNLIKNASDAMGLAGKLVITIKKVSDGLSIRFLDNGSGFPPEQASRIFEPFFTSKGRGKGTGLGLAICKDIIEKYNGTITAKNAPNGGSVFIVKLPVTQVAN